MATVTAPSGSVFASLTLITTAGPQTSNQLGIILPFAEPPNAFAPSDLMTFDPGSGGAVTITFVSDTTELAIPQFCFKGNCGLPEDGTVQLAASIMWADATTGALTATDKASFQSGVDAPVPEPASLVLLGGGCLAIVGSIRRRRLA